MSHRASSPMPPQEHSQAFAAAASSESASVPSVPLQPSSASAAAASALPRSPLVHRDSFGRPFPPSLAEGLGYSLPRNPALGPFHPDPPPLGRAAASEPVPIPGRAAAAAAASSSNGSPQFGSPSGALIPYDGVGSPGAAGGTPRRYTRDAIQAVSDRASALLNANTAPSRVMAFGVHTSLAVANAFTPTFAKTLALNQWSHYGEPLLNKVDQRLDEAFQMVEANRGGGAAGTQGQAEAAAASGAAAAAGAASSAEMSDESSAAAANGTHSAVGGAGGDAQRAQALALHQQEQAMSQSYWRSLQSQLVASRWYARVDSILLQNRVFVALSQVTRPAEAFYSCITEEFVSHDDVGEFMSALKTRVGPAWDDRLTPLALGFYQTAKAVRLRVFGAGRFVGGVVQRGKDSVHHSIDQLMQRWEQVLGRGDAYVDRWLPEREAQAALMPEDSRDAVAAAMALVALEGAGSSTPVKMEDAGLAPAAAASSSSHISPPTTPAAFGGSSSSSSSRRGSYAAAAAAGAGAGSNGASTPSPRMPRKRAISALDEPDGATAAQPDEDLTRAPGESASFAAPDALPASSMALALASSSHSNTVSPTSSHTVSDLTGKVTKRLRQRIPTLHSLTPSVVLNWSDTVRSSLTAHRWFHEVDEILLQNSFVSALAHVMQPAQHFYDTAMRIFQTTVIRQKEPTQQLITSGKTNGDNGAAAASGEMQDTKPPSKSAALASNSSSPPTPPSAAAAAAAAAAFIASTTGAPAAAASASPVADNFVVSLRSALGASWDDRLRVPALSFLQTAWRAAITQRMQQRAQTAAATTGQQP